MRSQRPDFGIKKSIMYIYIVAAIGTTLANRALKKPSYRAKIWIKTCFKPGHVWTVVLFSLSLSVFFFS